MIIFWVIFSKTLTKDIILYDKVYEIMKEMYFFTVLLENYRYVFIYFCYCEKKPLPLAPGSDVPV